MKEKTFNRFWFALPTMIALFAIVVCCDNPYYNVIAYGVTFLFWTLLGAWISDSIRENEKKAISRFLSLVCGIKL